MIRLFNNLPYKIKVEKDDDMIILNCLFSDPKQKGEDSPDPLPEPT